MVTYGAIKTFNIDNYETKTYSVDTFGGNTIIANKHIHKKKDKTILEAGEKRANVMDVTTFYSNNPSLDDYKYDYSKYEKISAITWAGQYSSSKDYYENVHTDDFLIDSIYDDGQKYNGEDCLNFSNKACKIFEQIVNQVSEATDKAVLSLKDLSKLHTLFKKEGKSNIEGVTNVRGDGEVGVYTVTYLDENNEEKILSFDFTTQSETNKEPELQDYEHIVDKGRNDADFCRDTLAEKCDKR